MAKFIVYAKMTSYCYVEVEANSPEEAEMIAEDIDGGEFTPYNNGCLESWDIDPTRTEEVK